MSGNPGDHRTGWGRGRKGSAIGSSTYQAGCRGRFFRWFVKWGGRIVPLPKRHGVLQDRAALNLLVRRMRHSPECRLTGPGHTSKQKETEAKENGKQNRQHAH